MKMRYLRENARTRCPSNVVAFNAMSQAEERIGKGKARYYKHLFTHARATRLENGKWTRSDECYANDPMEFWAWLTKRLELRRPCWCIGHDMGHLLTVMKFWSLVDQGAFSVTSLIDSDPPVIVRARHLTGDIVFLDVRNWYRQTLAELTELFYEPCEVAENAHHESLDDVAWVEQFSGACLGAFKALVEFVKVNDLGNLRYTLPAQAMAAYRHRFGPRSGQQVYSGEAGGKIKPRMVRKILPLLHRDPKILELERRACFGGESRIFFRGRILDKADFPMSAQAGARPILKPFRWGPCYALDMNSLFPFAMYLFRYPGKLVGTSSGCTTQQLAEKFIKYVCVADVSLCTWDHCYPVRLGQGMVFARGRFDTTLCAAELGQALGCGEVTRVHFHACYEGYSLFREYVQFFNNVKTHCKERGQTVNYNLAKLMMNSLYGKFGQRSYLWQNDNSVSPPRRWGRWTEVDLDAKTATRFRSIGGQVQRSVCRGESNESFPAIAACVVANARQTMYTYRDIAGPGNVYYQGVDSLIVNGEGYRRMVNSGLVDASKIGCMKLVKTALDAEFLGVRRYRLGDAWTIAGLPADNTEAPDGSFNFDLYPSMSSYVDSGPAAVPFSVLCNADFRRASLSDQCNEDGTIDPPLILRKVNDEGLVTQAVVGKQEGIYAALCEEIKSQAGQASGIALPSLRK